MLEGSLIEEVSLDPKDTHQFMPELIISEDIVWRMLELWISR